MAPEQPEPDWATLPKQVLHRIARYLDWRTDLPKIRAVCPSWRAHLPKNPPIISTTQITLPSPSPLHSLLLSPTHYYFLSPLPQTPPNNNNSPPPWLIRANQTAPNTYTLLSPFNTTKYFYPVPPISTTISLLTTNVLELSITFTLHSTSNTRLLSKKVVGGWALDSPFRFSILAQIRPNYQSTLLFWKLGDPHLTQVNHNSGPPLKVIDTAYYKKKFYAFDLNRWEIGVIDPTKADTPTPRVNMEFHPAPDILLLEGERTVVSFKGKPFYLGDVFLVPTRGGLYIVFEVGMVDEDGYNGARMIVYRMRESGVDGGGEITWDHAIDIDDHVFFIGCDTAFALPSASVNLPRWKANTICLFNRHGGHVIDGYAKEFRMVMPRGVECLEEIKYPAYWKYLSVFVMGEDEAGVVPFQGLPKEVFTGLFFPPPGWVKWRCHSLGGVEVEFDRLELGDVSRFREMCEGSDEEDYDYGSDEACYYDSDDDYE